VTAACLGPDLNEPPSRDSSVSADGALGEIMVRLFTQLETRKLGYEFNNLFESNQAFGLGEIM
jgi:hypothetical protein